MMKWLRRLLRMERQQNSNEDLDRRRVLFVSNRDLPEDTFAIVRVTSFNNSGLSAVNEIKVIYQDESEDEMIPHFALIVAEALRGGADVSLITAIEPDALGLDV